MTRANNELDEFGKRTLAPLQQAPPLDQAAALEAKAKYLLEGESLRKENHLQTGEEATWQVIKKHDIFWMLRQKTVMKSLVAILLVFAFILVGSSVTVYASQNSLPGQPLFAIKSWSEDVRLAMTSSPNAKLSLILNYTNTRVDELSNLVAGGKAINDHTADRYQKELADALQLATLLGDNQMQVALGEIKSHAEKQGITIKELISKLPPQAEPAVIKLQERLNEQVQLSDVGESDPKEFRIQLRERLQNLQRTKHVPDDDQPQSTPIKISITPIPEHDGDNNGNEMAQPSKVPEHGDPGKGEGQSTPGAGNHGQNPTHTPKP